MMTAQHLDEILALLLLFWFHLATMMTAQKLREKSCAVSFIANWRGALKALRRNSIVRRPKHLANSCSSFFLCFFLFFLFTQQGLYSTGFLLNRVFSSTAIPH